MGKNWRKDYREKKQQKVTKLKIKILDGLFDEIVEMTKSFYTTISSENDSYADITMKLIMKKWMKILSCGVFLLVCNEQQSRR